jgi:hypothetical protein
METGSTEYDNRDPSGPCRAGRNRQPSVRRLRWSRVASWTTLRASRDTTFCGWEGPRGATSTAHPITPPALLLHRLSPGDNSRPSHTGVEVTTATSARCRCWRGRTSGADAIRSRRRIKTASGRSYLRRGVEEGAPHSHVGAIGGPRGVTRRRVADCCDPAPHRAAQARGTSWADVVHEAPRGRYEPGSS